MGCNFSTAPVKVVNSHENIVEKSEGEENNEQRTSLTRSQHSPLSCNNGSIENEMVTTRNSTDILSPHRSKSVDLSRTGTYGRDDPPVATATIIRGPTTRQSSSNNRLSVPLPHQPSETPSGADNIKVTHSDSEIPPKHLLNRRRSSDGDVGKVTNVTCIPHSLLRLNPLLTSKATETKKKSMPFAPRNSHLTPTESQEEFFRRLDEKVAQSPNYYSEDDRSLASFHSLLTKDSSSSNGIMMSPIPQQVR